MTDTVETKTVLVSSNCKTQSSSLVTQRNTPDIIRTVRSANTQCQTDGRAQCDKLKTPSNGDTKMAVVEKCREPGDDDCDSQFVHALEMRLQHFLSGLLPRTVYSYMYALDRALDSHLVSSS